MNYCRAGHKKHDTKQVRTMVGPMVVYDYEKYKGYAGYCTGQDAVSETLEVTRSWDIAAHKCIEKILKAGDKSSCFIDVGSHIGYFSRLATNFGYKVFSFDGDPENVELIKVNVPEIIVANLYWFSEKSSNPNCGLEPTEIMKIDIEGSEQYAIKYFEQLFENKLVKNVIMEVSPCFNDSYPALIQKMVDYGFDILELDGNKFDYDYDFHQKDLWLKLTS